MQVVFYIIFNNGNEMNQNEKSHLIDVHVGEQLRKRRKHLHLSQSALGKMVGLSLQQIQKYELGTNRISAGKLYEFSVILRTSIEFFYDGIKIEDANIHDNDDNIPIVRTVPLTVLVAESCAEDESDIKGSLERSDVKTNIIIVHDGNELLQLLHNCFNKEKCSTYKPDIIILSLSLPKIDGISVLKDIKKDRSLQDIPVIILSNSFCRKDMSRGYNLGAAGFITKTKDKKDLDKKSDILLKYWANTVVLPIRNG